MTIANLLVRNFLSYFRATQNGLIVAIAMAHAVTVSSCKQRDADDHSSLENVNYVYTIPGSEVKSKLAEDQTVQFFIVANGVEEPVLTIADSDPQERFSAIVQDQDHFKISWHGVIIGERRGERTEICGEQFGYQTICEATFVQRPAGDLKSPNTLLLGLTDLTITPPRYLGESPSMNLSEESAPKSATADLSKYAMNQISQRGTATCLYNSATGIIEWYRNKSENIHERLSAPDVLARLPGRGEKRIIDESDETLNGVLPDALLPTQGTYDRYNSFSSAKNYAKPIASKYASSRVKFPAITGTTLFMHQEPANGRRNGTYASSGDMQKVREWLMVKKRPVHFFHYYGETRIWHAVIALGWDDGRKLILIKDSLGGTSNRGSWRSIADMQRKGYGAVGTMEANSSSSDSPDSNNNPNDNPNDDQTSSTSTLPSEGTKLVTVMQKQGQRDNMYVYSSKRASKIEIQDTKGKWQELDITVEPQKGWPTIGKAWTEALWRETKNEVNVRILINGQSTIATVPLSNKR